MTNKTNYAWGTNQTQNTISGNKDLYQKIRNYLKIKGRNPIQHLKKGTIYMVDGGSILFIENGWEMVFMGMDLSTNKDLAKIIRGENN